MVQTAARIAALVGVAIAAAACNFYVEKPGSREGILDPSVATLSYAGVRDAILSRRCVSCHGTSGGVSLGSYSSVKENLAKIRESVASGAMPPRRPLSDAQASLLLRWIDAGAPEFATGPAPSPSATPPEPLLPTFRSIRDQVLVPKCLDCHSHGGEAQKVPLETLSDLLNSPSELVIPGNPEESGLIIAITRDDDKRMPPPKSGAPKLSSDEIAVIQNWISVGAPE